MSNFTVKFRSGSIPRQLADVCNQTHTKVVAGKVIQRYSPRSNFAVKDVKTGRLSRLHGLFQVSSDFYMTIYEQRGLK